MCSDPKVSRREPWGLAQNTHPGSETWVNILQLSMYLRDSVPEKAVAHSQEAAWKSSKDEKKTYIFINEIATLGYVSM